MKYHLIIFGCQMNYADAERVDSVMNSLGYAKTGKMDDADVVIIVACSVRQHAIEKIYGLNRKFEATRKKHPLKTILTGCVLDSDKKKMSKFFDYIFPINELQKLPKNIKKVGADLAPAQKRAATMAAPTILNDYLSIVPAHNSRFQAYVPISNGCNQFCSYCVVPYARGREVYRDAKEIIEECKCLIEKGYKEIMLLGQTINSYSHKGVNFSELLCRIDTIPGDFWIRFLSSHPNFFTLKLIEVWKNSKHITPYLHLAVQSGDNTILKKMNRKYTVGKYLRIVKKMQKAIPDITISTDIIVGYCGETKKQFENTVELMKKVKFDMVYIAKYSPRKGTVSEKIYKDNISWEEKKKRHEILNTILAKTALENNKKMINKPMRVLVETAGDGFFMAKTYNFKNVKIIVKAGKDLIGKFIVVKIVKASSWGLTARLMN